MTPMQKIEEAWKLLCETGKDTMLYGIKATGRNNRFIRIPYTTTIGDSFPTIRVMDCSTPQPEYDLILTGWYSLRQFKDLIDKYNLELTEEV